MISRPLFRSPEDVTFILPVTPDAFTPTGATFETCGGHPLYTGTLTTPEGPRDVFVVEGQQPLGMVIASLMWRYGFRGTLKATPRGLWLVYPQRPGVLRGVRLHTKHWWTLSYGAVVDAVLPA